MRLSLREVASIVEGDLLSAAPLAHATGAVSDSREIEAGQMFAAMRGDYLDGHDFVNDAFRRGAAVALVERAPSGVTGPMIVVPDVAAALTTLAAHVRDVVDPLVVGITGSTGKTSTKDMLFAIAARKFRTIASERSFNNELGLPLTLLRCGVETEVLICEMGSRGPGHITSLCDIARPHVGVVTNIGVTHFEQFQSTQAIVEAKGELIRALPETGSAVLNGDDESVLGMKEKAESNVLIYGLTSDADVSAVDIRVDELGRPSFRILHAGDRSHVELPVSGRHQVTNALAAAAAGLVLGLSLDECVEGLEQTRLSPWRMEISRMGGIVFVNDAYNANPTSVGAALDTCADMKPPSGRVIAVLGHMAELGKIEESEHYRVGSKVAALAHRLITVGPKAKSIAVGARDSGMVDVVEVEDADAVQAALGDLVAGDVVLVKGSRAAGLEKLADTLKRGVAT